MQQVHVFIATTAGPVRVQYACGSPYPDEGPPIDHHAGVGGEGAADFNQEYDRFAKLVISRWFGRRWFNASIETDIQQGESWKLALLSAHAVEADGARKLTDAEVREGDWVVLATGNVTQDSQIRGVDCIDRKFQGARAHLDAWLDAGSRVVAVVPKDNDGDVPDEFRTYRRNGNRLAVVATADVPDLLSQLSRLELLTGPATDTGRKAGVSAEAHAAPKAGSSRRLWWMGAAVLALAVILAREESMPDMVRDAIEMSRDIAGRGVEEIARVAKSGVTISSVGSRKIDGEEDRVELTTEAPAVAAEEPQTVTKPRQEPQIRVRSEELESVGTSTGGSIDAVHEIEDADSNSNMRLMTLPILGPQQSLITIRSIPREPDIRLSILPLHSDGDVRSGNNRSNLRQLVTTTIAGMLSNVGYRIDVSDSAAKESGSSWDEYQQAREQSTRVLLALRYGLRRYPTGDRIHVDLEANIFNSRNEASSKIAIDPKFAMIHPECRKHCEEQKTYDVVNDAAKRLSERLLDVLLSSSPPQLTPYGYRLTFDDLTREERAGVENALTRLPGYVGHHSVLSDDTRSEWKYVSHFGAKRLYLDLLTIVEREGLMSVSVMPGL